MDKTKMTPQETPRPKREATVNPRPPQDQYPTEDEPTPNYDGYPVGTGDSDANSPDKTGELTARLNRLSGDEGRDAILNDKDAAADQRDKPTSPYAD